ncbi:2-C-methyl-D-erythritol 4-phosphate cytidylyltransferase [Desulfococcaceae bacterium HSG7]|nr:2-C-methyl-D-erythritol 4-phosphate cytidylyltransferase [Desulfococcaceae bacterium HSG7]
MVFAIIVAAGKGVRMRQTVRKQYLELAGKPLIGHTLIAIDACKKIDKVILVIPQADFNVCGRIINRLNLQKNPVLVAGGVQRQTSVYNGLCAIEAVAKANGIVIIHDGVRPFVTSAILNACIDGAYQTGACITGIPAFDTLWQIDLKECVKKIIPRKMIRMAQTPQAFEYNLLKNAHDKALQEGFIGTDDAALVENGGDRVKMIDGSRFNIKITTAEDMELARMFFQNLNIIDATLQKEVK